MNPFTNRGVITNEADFMAARSNSARSSSGCARCRSSSVVSERRIWKSSLLYHLAQAGTRRIENGG
ncbi:MAG: hypothetical protein ACREBD_30055 [Blastocatellia bacterium]